MYVLSLIQGSARGSKAENVLLVPTTYGLKKNEVIHIFVLVGSN